MTGKGTHLNSILGVLHFLERPKSYLIAGAGVAETVGRKTTQFLHTLNQISRFNLDSRRSEEPR